MSHPNRSKVKDWPEFLREFRQRNDLTQKQLADLLQIAASYIENWEAGKDTPPPYLKKALQLIELARL